MEILQKRGALTHFQILGEISKQEPNLKKLECAFLAGNMQICKYVHIVTYLFWKVTLSSLHRNRKIEALCLVLSYTLPYASSLG